MRLIYSILFLFGSYGASFAKASPVLDIDTYDAFDFNLVVDRKPNYNLETFTPKSGNVINTVTDSTYVLYSSDDNNGTTVSSVEVYSVQSVPQLVSIKLNDSGVEYLYKKFGNVYTSLNKNQFTQSVESFEGGQFTPNLEFTVDINSKPSSRNLYTKQLKLLDGVRSFVYKPTGEQKLTLVSDGPKQVVVAELDEQFTEVRAFENQGNFVLLSVEGVKNGHSTSHFYHKKATWVPITQNDYTHYLVALRPMDVQGRVTLDLSHPDENSFHVQKDFYCGLIESTFSPNPGLELKKVTNGDVELWSSNENRSSKVVAYFVGDTVELVQVEVKSVNGETVYVSLYNSHGDFSPVSEHEFSERVELFKNYLKEQRSSRTGTTPSGPTVLDVASPDPSFNVLTKSFKGVVFKEFVPTSEEKLTKVVFSGKEIWTSKPGDTVTHVNVFLKNNVPAVYEVVGTESSGRDFDVFMKWDQTLAVRLNLQMFSDFLNSAAKPPSFTTSLDLDFEGSVPDNVTVYSSKIYGVPNTVFQAADGFYFHNVTAGERIVWGASDHPGVTVNQVVLYKNGETGVLLELEGFSDGNFVSYYFSFIESTWTPVDEARFKRELLVLRLPELASETHTFPARRHSFHHLPGFDGDTSLETPEETPEAPELEGEVPELQVLDLDTERFDESQVNFTAGSDDGYYYKMYAPKGNSLFGSVSGPSGFSFNGNGERLVTLVKFYWVHGRLVGGNLFTVSKAGQVPLVFYYTYQNQEWTYSMTSDALTSRLTNEAAFTRKQKKDLERLAEADANLKETLAKIKLAEEKELEKKRKAEEKGQKIVLPKKLSHKTKLYDEMADFEQHPPPKVEVPEETEEELKKRTHKYAGEDVPVQSELLYFELSTPTENDFVHTKSYTCMGLSALDVTPFAGKYLHVVSSNGKRVWVSSTNKRATNMQLFYVDSQIVGAVLTLTSIVRGNLVSGEEYDYLFVKDGELQKVEVRNFMDLANTRFQSAALLNLSKTPVTPAVPVAA